MSLMSVQEAERAPVLVWRQEQKREYHNEEPLLTQLKHHPKLHPHLANTLSR